MARLYEQIGSQLGYVFFRFGANLKYDILDFGNRSSFTDNIESAFGHSNHKAEILLPGQFPFRNIEIKSPVCIPTKVIKRFGLNEKLIFRLCQEKQMIIITIHNKGNLIETVLNDVYRFISERFYPAMIYSKHFMFRYINIHLQSALIC